MIILSFILSQALLAHFSHTDVSPRATSFYQTFTISHPIYSDIDKDVGTKNFAGKHVSDVIPLPLDNLLVIRASVSRTADPSGGILDSLNTVLKNQTFIKNPDFSKIEPLELQVRSFACLPSKQYIQIDIFGDGDTFKFVAISFDSYGVVLVEFHNRSEQGAAANP